jgi:Alpha/beta hydrolase domain
VNCPGNNWGRGTLRANPVPSTGLVNRVRAALRDWVMRGIDPPPSQWPTLIDKTLVEPTKEAMGFPSGVPGIPDSIFLAENFIFPVFDYDWGPQFNESDATGVPTNAPPPILHVIKMLVPRVDADGNELGGVPTVQRDAPLGTYLGWNVTFNHDYLLAADRDALVAQAKDSDVLCVNFDSVNKKCLDP